MDRLFIFFRCPVQCLDWSWAKIGLIQSPCVQNFMENLMITLVSFIVWPLISALNILWWHISLEGWSISIKCLLCSHNMLLLVGCAVLCWDVNKSIKNGKVAHRSWKMVSLVAKSDFMSKILGSLRNERPRFGRNEGGHKTNQSTAQDIWYVLR